MHCGALTFLTFLNSACFAKFAVILDIHICFHSRSGSEAGGEGGSTTAAPSSAAEVLPPTDLQTESLSDISDDDADEILNRDYEVRTEEVGAHAGRVRGESVK